MCGGIKVAITGCINTILTASGRVLPSFLMDLSYMQQFKLGLSICFFDTVKALFIFEGDALAGLLSVLPGYFPDIVR
jgi:hypothetical protein